MALPTTCRLGWICAGHRSTHALILDHPEDQEMRVCPETVHQALDVRAGGGLRREFAAALRTGRTRRTPHHDVVARTPRFIGPMVLISDRPAEIADRAVPGHREGDLVIGADGASAIGTLVERAAAGVGPCSGPTTAALGEDVLRRQ